MVDHLLRTSPGVKLLVTSREPLRLTSEWRLDLDGLPYPRDVVFQNESLPTNGRYESIDLFVQTARQHSRHRLETDG